MSLENFYLFCIFNLTIEIDNVIGPNGLLSTKARILVTNSVSFVKQFDSLAYIRRGIVLEHGSYKAIATDPTTELYKLM